MIRGLMLALLMLAWVSSASAIGFGGGAQAGVAFWATPDFKFENGETFSLYGLGFTFGGHADLNVVKFFSARLSLDYWTFASDKNKMQDLIAKANPGAVASDIKFEGWNAGNFSINLSGIGKIPTAGALKPYGIVGVSINIMSTGDPKVTYQGQDYSNIVPKIEGATKFGLNFGAGTEFRLAALSLYLQIEYYLIFTSDQSTGVLPIRLGVTLP
jgi:opacity protein-like surface antigen